MHNTASQLLIPFTCKLAERKNMCSFDNAIKEIMAIIDENTPTFLARLGSLQRENKSR